MTVSSSGFNHFVTLDDGSIWATDENGNPVTKVKDNPAAALPDRPNYQSVWDPKTMSMEPYSQQQLSGINLDMRGMERFREEALRSGPSAWSRLAMGRQNMEEANARDSATRQISGKRAEAFSNLAQRGGLDSGARERVARGAMKDSLDMQQDISRQGSLNRLQIESNDEQNRVQQLGMLPGMEVQALQPALEKAKLMGQARQLDITNQMNDKKYSNDFDMQAYQEQMKRWGAERTAQATENSGK